MHLSGARRDQGTSPRHSFSDSQSEESAGEFQPMAYETDRGTSTREYADAHNSASSSGLEGGRDFGQLVQSQQTGASLGQLWQRFNEGRSLVNPHPTNESEPSLLLRLERLKRLLHGEGGEGGGGVVPGTGRGVSTSGPPAAAEQEGRWPEVTGDDGGHPRWPARTQEEESLSPASSHSSPAHGRHRFPAERDSSETLSTSRGSVSTVDTERLVRAFGSDRVRRSLTPGSPSLEKLYHAIHQQREAGESRGEGGERRGEGLERIREGGERREEEGERSEGTRWEDGWERTREGGERREGRRGEGGERTREGGERSEERREEGWERTRDGGEKKGEEQRREGGGKTEDTPPWVPSSQSPGAESRVGLSLYIKD